MAPTSLRSAANTCDGLGSFPHLQYGNPKKGLLLDPITRQVTL